VTPSRVDCEWREENCPRTRCVHYMAPLTPTGRACCARAVTDMLAGEGASRATIGWLHGKSHHWAFEQESKVLRKIKKTLLRVESQRGEW
jgi:hypothetical protein